MFKQALAADLSTIFGVDNIVWGKAEDIKQTNCLCVQLSLTSPIKGGSSDKARISGTIAFIGSPEDECYDFLSTQIEAAPLDVEKRFWFSRMEEAVKITLEDGRDFYTYRLPFIYFYEAAPQQPTGFIEYAKIFFEMLLK
ncbi:hypothetical protein AAIR98_001337 [Elusimicrobium simillimum]|uniref:hypothetical protein n=1 Tax=Elusimicrobium simillimum TaxID=3143438 RepID=UPI003C6FE046